jgi:CheY-like chemotaxis protein
VSPTILLLERNVAVQELIDQALRESGYHVLSTRNALEALEFARRVRIDIVVAGDVLDVRTEDVVGELRSIQPSLRVVDVTGRKHDPERRNGTRLAPPFSLDDLIELLAAGADGA